MKRQRVTMFAHAGADNHGCEAIVRSTVKILGNKDYALITKAPDSDKAFGLDKLAEIVKEPKCEVKRDSLVGYYLRLKSRIGKIKDYDVNALVYSYGKLADKSSIYLSVGGDNYCYNGIIGEMRAALKVIGAIGAKSLLWGCSIDKAFLDDAVLRDLRTYSAITARESVTMENLADKGIIENVYQVADPAFLLDTEYTEWTNPHFSDADVIGINVSDFMKFYEKGAGGCEKSFYNLVKHIIANTAYNVALIPHVLSRGNDDLVPLKKIAAEIGDNRVAVVDGKYNCMQYKSLISKCRMFVGCRTHSTIAAYSTCVPTLVVGYSVKSLGICKDIFGSNKGLVVPVTELSGGNELVKSFQELCERKKELRDRLTAVMPEYKKRAYINGEVFDKIQNG